MLRSDSPKRSRSVIERRSTAPTISSSPAAVSCWAVRTSPVADTRRAESEKLHEELLPRVREHMDRTRDRIREVLTPEQQEQFESLRRHHHRRYEHFLLGR